MPENDRDSGKFTANFHIDPLERFIRRLPERPYCGHAKWSKVILPKTSAIQFAYIQVNTTKTLTYLVFDLDYEGGAVEHEKAGLPPPTFLVLNRANFHCHSIYELIDSIPVWRATKPTKVLLKHVVRSYTDALRADRCITTQRLIVKNPLAKEDWQVAVYGRPYSLTELAQFTTSNQLTKAHSSPNLRAKPFQEISDPASRNCSLFEFQRRRAYQVVPATSSHASLSAWIEQDLACVNNREMKNHPKKVPLSLTELRSLAKSIAGFCWRKRNEIRQIVRGHDKNSGIMGLPKMQGLSRTEYKREKKRRQRQGALYTAGMKKNATEAKIRAAVAELMETDEGVTVSAIARLANISSRTVRRYSRLWKE